MLVPGFYHINSFVSSDEKIEAIISLNKSHEIYEGHFPDQPVTPGVMQLQMIKELVEKAKGRRYLLSELSSAKYLTMMLPSVCESINATIAMTETDKNQISINAVLYENEQVFLKLKAVLTEK